MRKRKRKEKKSDFVENQNSDLSTYTKGAFLGALVGGVGGLILGKRIILGIIIGGIAGGYISYQINNNNSSLNLKNFKQYKK